MVLHKSQSSKSVKSGVGRSTTWTMLVVRDSELLGRSLIYLDVLYTKLNLNIRAI